MLWDHALLPAVRSRRRRLAAALGALAGLAGAAPPGCGGEPGGAALDPGWEAVTPRQAGFDDAGLETLHSGLAERRTRALLVLHDGRLVLEAYAGDWGPEKLHYTASLQKSLAGGMALLLALGDGRVTLDEPAARWIPAWRDDPLRSRITLRQLANHSAGVEDAEEPGVAHARLRGWKGAFWSRARNPFAIALAEAPILHAPGTRFTYSNPAYAALAYALTASLRDAPQHDLRGLLHDRLMAPIGVPDAAWEMGYGETSELDGLALQALWGGGRYTARAVARVGALLLERGRWQGKALFEAGRLDEVLAAAGAPLPEGPPDAYPAAGAGWYVNANGAWPSLPRDAFVGTGSGHQLLLVVPSWRLVLVRQGESLASDLAFWRAFERHVFEPLAAARVAPPYPPSPVIAAVRFDAREKIVRRALGSDNWPITWADDDLQYTAYGDGWGFEPGTGEKLSLGFARIRGGPERFDAENVRAPSGEDVGDGPLGAKASGLLGLDGTLYAWVRNRGNAQLAWSSDLARSWTWGFRFETSFGSPSFLNFGRGYAGARDAYVYTYSQDGPSAYASDDGIVLARVHRDRIRQREAWEFFAGSDAAGEPRWSPQIEARQPVFRFARRCARVDVVHHAGLGRYLMALAFDQEGGWGLFDAPEPWGPWTTAFFTLDWGLGSTHGYRIPSRWIAGSTLQLVFSGREHRGVDYDAFCLRRMQLELVP